MLHAQSVAADTARLFERAQDAFVHSDQSLWKLGLSDLEKLVVRGLISQEQLKPFESLMLDKLKIYVEIDPR